jgi:diguanylate cyclase (GGDEF)-like protein
MNGLSTLLFVAATVGGLALVYGLGLTGFWIATVTLFAGWIAIIVTNSADVAILGLDALMAAATLAFALRWSFRHRRWQQRLVQDKAESDEKQREIGGVVQHFKEKISERAADVDRGLKQYELVRRLAEAVSWEEMSPSLERALKHFFRVEGWALYLTDDKNALKLVQRRGLTPEPRAEDFTKQEPFLHTFMPDGAGQGRVSWALGMPLWRVHERIGLLVLRIPDLGADQQPALLAEASTFAVQLIFAMAKAKLYRELDERSRTDGLTGLSRRGPFEERLREEVARAKSFRTTFSVLMIDIDHFKRFNDNYGHQVGDEVLRTVSHRLKEGLYETDVIARYGGEEFVCLLPRSEAAGLKTKADRIRERVASEPFIIGLEAITITISIGIAHFPTDGQKAEDVVGAADRALYAAKEAGRNCVMEAASLGKS